MIKLILSVIGGLALAFAIVFASDGLFHRMAASPPPDPRNTEAMGAYVAGQPLHVLATVLIGWAAAAFAGAAAAAYFAERGERPGWIVTGLFLLATIANFFLVPHPAWMMAAAVAMIVVAGWLGSRVGARAVRRG